MANKKILRSGAQIAEVPSTCFRVAKSKKYFVHTSIADTHQASKWSGLKVSAANIDRI